MSGSFGSIPYADFYKSAGEFFKGSRDPNTPLEVVNQGHKALTIMYMALEDCKPHEEVGARAIMNLAGKRLLDAEIGPSPLEVMSR